ncbi:hypothetical protein GCM10009718_12140 [Isoptericola halotolerans]|uniref:Uncharacterized protein n=1 Tax=Isoptericola halotolerans TaxID=300560 RepID=A0ABX1ZZ27_9MICO|nr:hypothetical protein [Isoptericola halotolerans]NOV95864.1 hypothetical protein [Isoptericola halotolerans]
MQRVVLAGAVVALCGGLLLGSAIALGGPVLTILAAALGAGGVVGVVLLTPPPRAPAHPATTTLGLPLRESAADVAESAEGGAVLAYPRADEAGAVVGTPAPVAA